MFLVPARFIFLFFIFYEQRFHKQKPTGVTFTLYLVLPCLIQRKLKIERWGLLLDRDRRVDMIKFTLVSNASKLNFFKSKYCFFWHLVLHLFTIFAIGIKESYVPYNPSLIYSWTIQQSMCLLDSDRASQHANKSAGWRWRNRIGLITDFTAQNLWLFRVRCLVYSYFLPFFSRSIKRILHHGLQDLYVIFCRKNVSECSFSRSYPQDISCWRFEVVFVEFFIWMNVLFFDFDIVYFLFI